MNNNYKNVNISTYENVKKGDYILFDGEYHFVYYDKKDFSFFIRIKFFDNGIKKFKRISLAKLVYCYHNRDIPISENIKIIYLDGNMSNHKIENIKMIYDVIPEELFNNWEFKYHGVNIETYINANCGDNILFCGRTFLVSKTGYNRSLIIDVTYLNKGNKFRKHFKLSDLIYCYYNRIIDIPDDKKIIFNDKNHYNMEISNMKLIFKMININDYNKWDFKYKNIKDIRPYINAEEYDVIEFCDRYYPVRKGTDDRLYIMVKIIDDNNNKLNKYVYLHQLIYEFYYKELISYGFIIHHIDHDKHNNHPENLMKVTPIEHVRIHKNKPVINLNNGEEFDSVTTICKLMNLKHRSVSFSASSKGRYAHKETRWIYKHELDILNSEFLDYNEINFSDCTVIKSLYNDEEYIFNSDEW